MQYLDLGRTGLRVSRLSMGTAAFGLKDYGIPTPGEDRLDSSGAIAIIRDAVDSGINFFDTAPSYGCSEELLGQALPACKDRIVATKVSLPENIETIPFREILRIVNASLESSLRALRQDVLDVVQIHNASISVLQQGDLICCLERAREAGMLRWIGASVYGPDTALTAVRTGKIDVVQIALNLLDQRMCGQVLAEAEAAGVGVVARSALLKGALTNRAKGLHGSMRLVKQASERAVQELGTTWKGLPGTAVRFCLTVPAVHTVLVGVRNRVELQAALAAESMGLLDPASMKTAYTLALEDELLLNPTYWDL